MDDNVINRKVARSFLKNYAFELTEAESGPEAIELVRKNRYDIIFMDHMTQVPAHFSPPKFYKGRYEPEGQEVQFVLTYSDEHREGAQLIHHVPRSQADGAVSDQS